MALPNTAKAVRRYQNLPHRSPNPTRTSRVANPGAPDMKRSKRPSSEVKAALERKNDHRRRLEMLEKAKIDAMAAMDARDMMSESLDSEEEPEDAATTTDLDDTLDDFIGNKEAGTSFEVESEVEDNYEDEGEGNGEDQDDSDDGVIMMATARTKAGKKDGLAQRAIVSQSLVCFMERADR
jgi:hypothetical protein